MTTRYVVLAGAATMLSAFAGCGGGDTETTKLTLDSKGRTLHVGDASPRRASPGDTRAFTQRLITTDGKSAGRLDGAVTVTEVATRGGQRIDYRVGNVQYTLEGGSVVVSGVYFAPAGQFIPARGVTRPIVGGTGDYKGARGQVVQTPKGAEIRSVLDIQTPKD